MILKPWLRKCVIASRSRDAVEGGVARRLTCVRRPTRPGSVLECPHQLTTHVTASQPTGLTPAQSERADKLTEVADTYSRKVRARGAGTDAGKFILRARVWGPGVRPRHTGVGRVGGAWRRRCGVAVQRRWLAGWRTCGRRQRLLFGLAVAAWGCTTGLAERPLHELERQCWAFENLEGLGACLPPRQRPRGCVCHVGLAAPHPRHLSYLCSAGLATHGTGTARLR